MATKRHRLFTRWFSRRIDLGVVFSIFLFVFIWFFLPAVPVDSAVDRENPSTHIRATRKSLCDVQPYLRPDLVLVPSQFSFAPVRELPDAISDIPHFAYTTSMDVILSEPEGMGQLADLATGINRNDHRILLVPSSAAGVLRQAPPETGEARLYVRTSESLGATRLRKDDGIWKEEFALEDPWKLAFWVSFHPEAQANGQETKVFVEERSGDVERDLRLLRIVSRMDVWENPMGEGIVWLQYVPATGGLDAD